MSDPQLNNSRSCIYPSTTHFISQFTQLLDTRQPIGNNIQNIIPLLSITNYHSTSRINRNVVYEYFTMVEDLMGVFKISILVNRLICSKTVPDCEILLSIVGKSFENVQLWLGMGESSYKFLRQSIMLPYLHYLKKRAHDQTYHEVPICRCKQYCIHLDGLEKQERDQYQMIECIRNHLSQCYYLINLITRVTNFSYQMLTFIRYYGGYFGCILDFNISLGIDLFQLYQRLTEQVYALENILRIQKQKLELILNFQSGYQYFQLCNDIEMLVEEIQKVNEGLYAIYYNCYYGNYLKKTTPKFISTDRIVDLIKRQVQKKKMPIILNENQSNQYENKKKNKRNTSKQQVRCLSTILLPVDKNSTHKKNKSAILKPEEDDIPSIQNFQSIKNFEDKAENKKLIIVQSSSISQINSKQEIPSQSNLYFQEVDMIRKKKVEKDVQLLLQMSDVFQKICQLEQSVTNL